MLQFFALQATPMALEQLHTWLVVCFIFSLLHVYLVMNTKSLTLVYINAVLHCKPLNADGTQSALWTLASHLFVACIETKTNLHLSSIKCCSFCVFWLMKVLNAHTMCLG